MIDLHSHTTGSDGEKNPQELIDMAINKKIEALAITDHDTTASLACAADYAKDKKIMFIPGIEFNCQVDKGQMHMLGLFIDYNSEYLQEKLVKVRDGRSLRNEHYIEELNKMGYEVTAEELHKISGGDTIGKPHFAKLFLKKGYIKTKVEMFDEFFNKPPLNKYEKISYSAKEVIEIVKEVNGISVLAHPHSLELNNTELFELLKELKSYGLDGVECYHSNHSKEQMKQFSQMAKELDLIITKGSDYHGPIVKPDIELGTGINNNIVLDNESELLEDVLNYYKQFIPVPTKS